MDLPDTSIWIQLKNSSSSGPQQTWVLKQQPVVRIGRSPDCEIVIQHPTVSRLHAELFWRGDHWELVNRGQFGTYVDGDRVESAAVRPGTELFRLGESGPFLAFLLDGAESETNTTMMVSGPPLPSIDAAARDLQVEAIASSDFFRSLKEKASGLRRRPDPAASTLAPPE